MLSTHPPLVVRLPPAGAANLGSAWTAVAARAVTIKSAATDEKAPDRLLLIVKGSRSCWRDFMVTNYIDGIISGD